MGLVAPSCADRQHAIKCISVVHGMTIALAWEWLDHDDARAIEIAEVLPQRAILIASLSGGATIELDRQVRESRSKGSEGKAARET
jgi:hypothetical protein